MELKAENAAESNGSVQITVKHLSERSSVFMPSHHSSRQLRKVLQVSIESVVKHLELLVWTKPPTDVQNIEMRTKRLACFSVFTINPIFWVDQKTDNSSAAGDSNDHICR